MPPFRMELHILSSRPRMRRLSSLPPGLGSLPVPGRKAEGIVLAL